MGGKKKKLPFVSCKIPIQLLFEVDESVLSKF